MNANLDRARHLIDLKRYESAEEVLRQVLSERPEESDAFGLLSICLVNRRELRAALAAIETGLRLSPNDAYLHYVRSFVYRADGDWTRTETSLVTALRLDPTVAEYRFHYAALLFDFNRTEESERQTLEALRLNPSHVAAANLHVLILCRRRKYKQAEELVAAILARDPEFAWSHRNLAFVSIKQGDYARAVAGYREALRLDPNDVDARFGLLSAMKQRNRAYRWLFWAFGAEERHAVAATITRGVYIGAAVGVLPALAIAFATGVQRGYLAGPLSILGCIVLYMPVHLTLSILFHWFGDSAITFLLSFDSLGRVALTWEEKRSAQFVLGCFASAIVFAICAVVFVQPWFALGVAGSLLLTFPIPFILKQPEGRQRRNAVGLVVAIAVELLAYGAVSYYFEWQHSEIFLLGMASLTAVIYARRTRTISQLNILANHGSEIT